MNIVSVLQELDKLEYKEYEPFLIKMIQQADNEGDIGAKISLLNEMIGFCRDSCQFNKSRIYSDQLLTLLDEEGLEGTQGYATSLLNVANADRASGDLEESLEYYKKAYDIYEEVLDKGDFLFASINNNMALLFQEMKDYGAACECLNKALEVIDLYDEKIVEKAITCTNLAQSQLRLKDIDGARKSIEMALDIFNDNRQSDYHYSGALAVYGELCFSQGEYARAAEFYNMAMNELEKQIGKNENYDTLMANRDEAMERALEAGQDISNINRKEAASGEKNLENEIRGLDICRKYYEEIGAPMIHDRFERYESRIAVGLVGEGSDCFGFDDVLSRDHDWGPGFCMWVDDVTYDAIGKELQEAYDSLPAEFMGYRRMTTREAEGRLGVIRVKDFYSKLLHMQNGIPRNEEEWLSVAEEDLAAATNGAIFKDDEGIFFSIRNALLNYYPEKVFRRKLAYEIVRMAQTGQYNFTRSLNRKDKVTASMYLAEFIEHTLKVLFLLNRKYAPYKKWMMKYASTKLQILPEITDILRAIADMDINDENVSGSVEIIANLVLNELKNQGLVEELNVIDPFFLEPYGNEIMDSIDNVSESYVTGTDSLKSKHMELVNKVVEEEWKAFDQVKNEGGRASCQDDWNTFSKMRKSQYMTWSVDMLESFLDDMRAAKAAGWNLITEKYGRMEASTAPEEYAKIEASLPPRDERTRAIVEEIVKIQVTFMEELAEDYPKVAKTARSIHTYEDSQWNTSYETYLRGELLTYSESTLSLYGKYVVDYVQKEKNLAVEIMNNTAVLYGYKSIDELEEKLE